MYAIRSYYGFRQYFEQESLRLPDFYTDRMRNNLGPLWEWLPAGSVEHDTHAYLRSLNGTERENPRASVLVEIPSETNRVGPAGLEPATR